MSQIPPQHDPALPEKLPRPLVGILTLLLIAGAVTFVLGITGPDHLRAWQIFLVNFVFWSGIALAGPVFAAIYHLTEARWGASIRHLAEGLGTFLPVSFLLFFLLFLGRRTLFPWALEPLPSPEKQVWLNLSFLFSRDALGLLLLYGVSGAFLYYSMRPDLGIVVMRRGQSAAGIRRIVTKGWRGPQAERERSSRFLAILAPTLLFLYAIIFSLIGLDLVMSLDPRWYSTLFGAYFFTSNFYTGLAIVVVIAILTRKSLNLESHITRNQFHDLGKLLFGFCLLTGSFLWSQYLVIWYGNLPEETAYVILRTKDMPWAPLAWTVLIVAFLGPFVVLLGRRVKRNPTTLASVACFIVAGMWLERYLFVVPSLWHTPALPLGWIELLITAGFLAAMVLTYLAFLQTVPTRPYLEASTGR